MILLQASVTASSSLPTLSSSSGEPGTSRQAGAHECSRARQAPGGRCGSPSSRAPGGVRASTTLMATQVRSSLGDSDPAKAKAARRMAFTRSSGSSRLLACDALHQPILAEQLVRPIARLGDAVGVEQQQVVRFEGDRIAGCRSPPCGSPGQGCLRATSRQRPSRPCSESVPCVRIDKVEAAPVPDRCERNRA